MRGVPVVAKGVVRSRPILPLLALSVAFVVVACSTSDLVVGEDGDPTLPDASPLDGGNNDTTDTGSKDDASPTDSGKADANDASPGCPAPATCVAKTEGCKALANGGAGCVAATDTCCAQTCPQLSPPAPSFCDGGPVAALYDASGCVVGYQCAPIACSAGGGQCVGLSPSSCPNGHFGDATKYSCGPGIGVACCLP